MVAEGDALGGADRLIFHPFRRVASARSTTALTTPTVVGGAGTVIDGTRLRAIVEASAHRTVTRVRSAGVNSCSVRAWTSFAVASKTGSFTATRGKSVIDQKVATACGDRNPRREPAGHRQNGGVGTGLRPLQGSRCGLMAAGWSHIVPA